MGMNKISLKGDFFVPVLRFFLEPVKLQNPVKLVRTAYVRRRRTYVRTYGGRSKD